jgi:hypothetical protein
VSVKAVEKQISKALKLLRERIDYKVWAFNGAGAK